jgi:hypothetical protein
MDLDKILSELRRDRDSLDEAILALERLLPKQPGSMPDTFGTDGGEKPNPRTRAGKSKC